MDFIEILDKLLKEKGVSAHKMSIELGLNKNAVSAWREKGNLPNGETLIKIADYFDKPVDYLLGKNQDVTVAASIDAPEGYSSLSDEQKRQINELIEFYKNKNQK